MVGAQAGDMEGTIGDVAPSHGRVGGAFARRAGEPLCGAPLPRDLGTPPRNGDHRALSGHLSDRFVNVARRALACLVSCRERDLGVSKRLCNALTKFTDETPQLVPNAPKQLKPFPFGARERCGVYKIVMQFFSLTEE